MSLQQLQITELNKFTIYKKLTEKKAHQAQPPDASTQLTCTIDTAIPYKTPLYGKVFQFHMIDLGPFTEFVKMFTENIYWSA